MKERGGPSIATLRPVAIRSGPAALAALPVVDDVLAGRSSVLPVLVRTKEPVP